MEYYWVQAPVLRLTEPPTLRAKLFQAVEGSLVAIVKYIAHPIARDLLVSLTATKEWKAGSGTPCPRALH
jgi:hypothetical protein